MARKHGRSAGSRPVVLTEEFLTLILLRVPWKELMPLKCVSRQWYSLITAPHFIRLCIRSLPSLDNPNTPSPRLKSSSSSQEVVLNDEDLLTLILLRVPWTKLNVLKCVSRNWLSLITTLHFRSLLPPLRASGLFIQCPWLDGIPEVYFIPLDNRHTPSTFDTFTFANDPYEEIRILLSCSGLLLHSTTFVMSSEDPIFYVSNPSTKYCATLPKLPAGIGQSVNLIGLTFDPSKSLHYKVIAFVITSESAYVGDFHIYSSETRTWKASIKSIIPGPGLTFHGGVYWNGCMHWLKLNSDPEAGSDCVYFNVDEERLGTFPRPPISMNSTSRSSLYFGESEDHLHVIEVCLHATSLSVYEMKSDYSGWFLKYQINLDPIFKAFPEMTKHKSSVAVLSLVRRENFNEDSFLVLEIPGKALRYNLVDRSFKVISDYIVDFDLDNTDYWPPGNCDAWQYVQSLPCA